jgi:predicted MPP superfamily phosphohydrolase
MKLYTEVYVLLVLITLLIDLLLYKQSKKSIFINILFILLPGVIFIGGFTWVKFFYELFSAPQLPFVIMWFNLLFLVIYIPKLLWIVGNLVKQKTQLKKSIVNNAIYISTALYLLLLFYGTFITTNRIKITKVEISFQNLPASFDNYTIVQISDVHLGSRPTDKKFYKNVVEIINNQKPDIVVFTGDMVNNFAAEMVGFDPVFLRIKAKNGKFAVLGNHDYGDYTVWNSSQAKSENLQQIKKSFTNFGFRLLNNESIILKNGLDSIGLIGVENYRKKDYNNYSNLKKALKDIDNKSFKILLSHNPEHWEKEILPQTNIDLTLSGHTHAAQMGVQLNGKVYSPAVFLYKQYNGLYEKENQKIYVSRGIGYIGLPLLIGLNPEITVIKLKIN